MKKTILIFSILMLFSSSALAWKKYTRTIDQEREGYGTAAKVEWSDNQGNEATIIGCKDPGTSPCPTVHNTGSGFGISANAQGICSSFVLNAITNGQSSGSETIVITGEGTFYLTWITNTLTGEQTIEIIQY